MSRARPVVDSLGLLTTKFAILQKAVESTVEKAELFIRSVCLLHTFIIKENMNGDEALLRGAINARLEDPGNLTRDVAVRLTTRALDFRLPVPMSGHFNGRIMTCSKPLPCYHYNFTVTRYECNLQ
jgi:hypothetical protein